MSKYSDSMKQVLAGPNRIIILVALFIMATGNYSLFAHIFEVYPASIANIPFLLSLTVFFVILTMMLLLLVCHGRATRWVLAIYLLASSQAAYYMDQFGVILDSDMIDNIFQSNPQEIAGLISASLVIRTLLFGILPIWLLMRYKQAPQTYRAELISKAILLAVLLACLVAVVAPFTSGYASFFRQHKIIRAYANPIHFTYSLVVYVKKRFKSSHEGPLLQSASDAVMVGSKEKNELLILVVGEAARADHFSLNGYQRVTNPELARQDVVSLRNVSSCGTSTGISVPCMFSALKRKGFDQEEAMHKENVLDVLGKQGVQILWRDNNSDSKGVALRVQYESFRTAQTNPVCDDECRDIGMLQGLDKFIASNKNKDILIVLHQMGNHGPEYYKRYPKNFERFKPVCASSELRDCSKEQIDNAYDNAILYTDHFLSSVIDFLKLYDGQYETGMLYVSDHGESLGEHGLYLHGAPYSIAPDEQTHIGAIVWLGKQFDYSIEQIRRIQDHELSHDDLFCMLLAGFEIDSKSCSNNNKIFKGMAH